MYDCRQYLSAGTPSGESGRRRRLSSFLYVISVAETGLALILVAQILRSPGHLPPLGNNFHRMNMKIWNWLSSPKQLRAEIESLRERVKSLEKKEREMQLLNVNLKRENDCAIATLNQKHTKKISAKERCIEGLLKHEQRLKK
jgi:hypothetical protein